MSSANDTRNFLILSLKWSKDDWLVWYRTACAGYTASLIHAGRYTEEEARSLTRGVEDQILAVSLEYAVESLAGQLVLRNDGRTIRRLKRLSAKKRKVVAT